MLGIESPIPSCQRVPRTVQVLSILLIALVVYSSWMPVREIFSSGYTVGEFGSTDFVEYWSAYQLFAEAKNPYDPIALLEMQKAAGSTASTPMMMWNPPILLSLFSVILDTQFVNSVQLWFLLSCLAVLLSWLMLWSIFSGSQLTLLPTLAATVFFFPLWDSFLAGQIGAFLMFGTVLLLWALLREWYWLSGVALVILSLKPHLSYLVVLVLFDWAYYRKRWTIVIAPVLYLTVLTVITEYLSPGIFGQWFDALTHTSGNERVPITAWQVATLVGAARMIFGDESGVPLLPMIAIPGFSAIVILAYSVVREPDYRWREVFPLLLCLSYLTAPYGWIFDQSMLVVAQVAILFYALKNRNMGAWCAVLACIALQSVTLAFSQCCILWHHHYIWYALSLFTIWLIAWISYIRPTCATKQRLAHVH